jgi:thiol-disulfide isomerase/thioredoxin
MKQILLIHAPSWCGHCQTFEPKWRKLVDIVQNKYGGSICTEEIKDKDPEIKTIDEKYEGLTIEGYPMIVIANVQAPSSTDKVSKDDWKVYKGKRRIADIINAAGGSEKPEPIAQKGGGDNSKFYRLKYMKYKTKYLKLLNKLLKVDP